MDDPYLRADSERGKFVQGSSYALVSVVFITMIYGIVYVGMGVGKK